jgi:hypothetical protein
VGEGVLEPTALAFEVGLADAIGEGEGGFGRLPGAAVGSDAFREQRIRYFLEVVRGIGPLGRMVDAGHRAPSQGVTLDLGIPRRNP